MPVWKQHQSTEPLPMKMAIPPASPAVHVEPMQAPESTPPLHQALAHAQSTLARGIVVHGEISGSDALYLNGTVEGIINIPGERVTVGPNGRVHAPAGPHALCISAREIIIVGCVEGSVAAEDRVEIRANGSLSGDISTQRISIEDGAFFRGGIDIRKPADPIAPESAEPALFAEAMR